MLATIHATYVHPAVQHLYVLVIRLYSEVRALTMLRVWLALAKDQHRLALLHPVPTILDPIPSILPLELDLYGMSRTASRFSISMIILNDL